MLEERRALLRVVAELVAENAQSVGRVTEAAGHLGARLFLHEESAEGFVLAVEGRFGAEEELGLASVGYLLSSIESHV